ncbi:MAG: flagellar biosynthesis protein FlhF [Oscillospiraceae bacterium]|nr:flagellar biosynthesis protein FlhF [Oscillospiraceae bacterium]
MNVKRYLAEDVTEAMGKVRAELGLDAFILNTRKIRRHGVSGWFRRPLVEVVAAYEPAPTPPPAARRAEPPPLAPLPLTDVRTGERVLTPNLTAGPEKIGALESKIDSLSATLDTLVGRIRAEANASGDPPEVEALVDALLEGEVHEAFAHRIGREAADIARRRAVDPAEVMEQLLKQYLGEAAPIQMRRYRRTVVIMVGPTGVGKTTTIAKLAAVHALNHGARVGIITTDTYRIAAVEQLRTYAEILSVPITVVYAPEEMETALREQEQCDIVFIDTAGKSPNDPTLEPELRALLAASGADEVHLVLSAATSFTGCLNIVRTYSFLDNFKLLFTKMDETPVWGMLLNLKMLTDRAVSYMTAGQTVPDDIEVMNARKITDRLLGACQWAEPGGRRRA